MNFNKEQHTYEKDGKRYQSVSKFVEQFKAPFQKMAMAAKVAQRDGMTTEEVIEKWDINADISILYGNAIHRGIEYWIKFGEMSKLPHIRKATKKFAEKYDRDKLLSEVVVYNEDLMIAGTIDQIERIKKGRVNIIDVKTNYEMDKEAYNYFKEPINLPQTKINEYRLKLAIYKYLLEKANKVKVEAIKLEHWKGTKFETIVLEPIEIENLFDYKPKKTIKLNI